MSKTYRSFREAFANSGNAATLYTLATGLLRETDKNISKSCERMLLKIKGDVALQRELCMKYLYDVSLDMAGMSATGKKDHPRVDTHDGNVPSLSVRGRSDQPMNAKSQRAVVAPAPQPRRRTKEEKAAARAALSRTMNAIYEHKIENHSIGSIQWGELIAIHDDLTRKASHNLLRGIDQTIDAVMVEKMVNHCVPTDQMQPVRRVLDAKTLKRFREEAKKEAPQRLNVAIAATERIISNKEIAA